MNSWISRVGTVSLVFGLVACGAPKSDDSTASADKGLKVVTTFLPITLFTEAVAGDCATVTALIPPNLGPHDFQATPADVSALGKAQVLVKNGLDMEGFLDKMVEVHARIRSHEIHNTSSRGLRIFRVSCKTRISEEH